MPKGSNRTTDSMLEGSLGCESQLMESTKRKFPPELSTSQIEHDSRTQPTKSKRRRIA